LAFKDITLRTLAPPRSTPSERLHQLINQLHRSPSRSPSKGISTNGRGDTTCANGIVHLIPRDSGNVGLTHGPREPSTQATRLSPADQQGAKSSLTVPLGFLLLQPQLCPTLALKYITLLLHIDKAHSPPRNPCLSRLCTPALFTPTVHAICQCRCPSFFLQMRLPVVLAVTRSLQQKSLLHTGASIALPKLPLALRRCPHPAPTYNAGHCN
jgi:hypothetical protein